VALAMEDVGILHTCQFGLIYGYLVYFVAIWYILWLFGLFSPRIIVPRKIWQPWVQSCDHNFRGFTAIFREKMAMFLKTNVLIILFCLNCNLSKTTGNFFLPFFGENISNIKTLGALIMLFFILFFEPTPLFAITRKCVLSPFLNNSFALYFQNP
jgi:hypothetical protein